MNLQWSNAGLMVLVLWNAYAARAARVEWGLSEDASSLKRPQADHWTATTPHLQPQPGIHSNRHPATVAVTGFQAQPRPQQPPHGHMLQTTDSHPWLPPQTLAQTLGNSHELATAAIGQHEDVKKGLGSHALAFTMLLLVCMVLAGIVRACYVNTLKPSPGRRRLKVDLLKRVSLFKRLPAEALTALAKAAMVKKFAAGEPIIMQGDEGNEFFMIKSGLASVEIDGHAVAILKSGDYFGEHSLVCSEPRIVTIRGQTEVTTFTITKKQFVNLGLIEKLGSPKRMAVAQGTDHDVEIQPPTTKTIEEEQLIIDAVKTNKSLEFMRLTEKSIKEMAAFAWKMQVASGTQIISQNDLTADYFYVVQEGSFLVTVVDASQLNNAHPKARGSDRCSRLSRLNRHSIHSISSAECSLAQVQGLSVVKGGSFGALALLYNAPRSATVTATQPSAVWVIARPHFKNVLLKAAEEQDCEHVRYLNNIEMTKSLPEQLKVKIAEALGEITFNQGDMPFKQGDRRNMFYILIEGTVNTIKDGASLFPDGDYPTASAGKGVPLGDWSLESEGDRHTATIVVLTEKARCLVLDRISYDILLGKQSPYSLPRLPPSSRKFGEIHFKDLKRLGMLGSGSFGAVELVEHAPSGDTYALKIQSKGFIVEQGFERLILNEKNLHVMCDSPFITRLIETFNEKDSLYMLLELSLGGDVLDLYSKKKLWGMVPLAKYYAAGIVFAFEHIHSKQIIHRDLKPENMVLSVQGHVKLTDLGLAKFVVGKTFTICGTEEYFAPELITSRGTTRAVDWWALGIVIFELLAGSSPFNSPSPMGIFKNIVGGIENVNFPKECGGDDVKGLIQGLCQREPHERLPMKQGATSNIKDHMWYRNFDWDAMFNLTMDPPYVPPQTLPICWTSRLADVPYRDPQTGWDKDFATST